MIDNKKQNDQLHSVSAQKVEHLSNINIISQNKKCVHITLSCLKYRTPKVEMLDMLLWFNVYFLVNKFKQLCKGYGLVDHEIFYVITNEGGALISIANLVIIVNTNICS